MRIYVTSDVHVDHWAQEYEGSAVLETPEKRRAFYEKHILGKFLPADACIIAGDIANDSVNQIEFLKFISERYDDVYVVHGNHDLTVNEYEHLYVTSEKRMDAVQNVFKDTNVHILDTSGCNGIYGTMGFCDFSVMSKPFGTHHTPFYRWKKWYDGFMWNYMDQHPKRIRQHYARELTKICKMKPKIVVTHYVPIQFGIPFDYRNSSSNTFFYFDGKKYLDMLPDGAIWVCGHTHTRKQMIYTNASGAHINIMCNAIGYPFDGVYSEFIPNDFVVTL